MLIGPQRAGRLYRGAAMFSAIDRCGSSACSRSAGTSTTPAPDRVVRDAARGARGRRRAARPAVGTPLAGERVEELVLPLSPRARRSPRISPGCSVERDVERRAPTRERLDLRARRARRPRPRARARAPPRRRPPPPSPRPAPPRDRACSRRSAPRRPRAGTSVPTSPPSRRIVARSQFAITSAGGA